MANHHNKHEDHEDHHVPMWLQWILAALIVINIASYFVVTWFTMRQLDRQMTLLRNRSSILYDNSPSTTEINSILMRNLDHNTIQPANDLAHLDEHILMVGPDHKDFLLAHVHDDPELVETTLQVLEQRKHKILLGTVMEILLDTVDLVNTFVHNFWLHIIYTVIKIGSVGMWTYAQADLQFPALWFIPIGLAMLITLLLLEWFESSRKYMLVLLIAVASISWITILIIRCGQMNKRIEYWADLSNDPRQNKTECDEHVHKLRVNMTQVIVGSVVMILLGLYGLAAIWLANLWVGGIFGVMHFAGNAWWVVKVTTDDYGLDKLFEVPLVYAVLISGVTMLYLYDLYYTQSGDNLDSSSFLKKVNSHAKLAVPTKKAVPRPSLSRITSNNASPKSTPKLNSKL